MVSGQVSSRFSSRLFKGVLWRILERSAGGLGGWRPGETFRQGRVQAPSNPTQLRGARRDPVKATYVALGAYASDAFCQLI